MESNRELLLSIYKAFNARHIDVVLAKMHPNVDWPNGMAGGRVLGTQNVREYWTRQWKLIDPKVDPISITELPDGEIDVEVHQVVHDPSGNLFVDQIVHHVYTIRNGLIEKMEIR